MKTLKILVPFLALAIAFTINSCDVEPIDPAIDPSSSTFLGTYYMTAFNSSVPTDLNGDGTASTNQMNETNCFAGNYIILNANNTFTANAKGVEISVTGSASVLACYEDPLMNGTWSLSGNQLTLTYTDSGIVYDDVFTVVGNTLKISTQQGEVVGTTSTGEPVYLTANLELVYTK